MNDATDAGRVSDLSHEHGSDVEQVHRVITSDQGVDPWVIAEEIVRYLRKPVEDDPA